jgi:deoxyribonuclease V
MALKNSFYVPNNVQEAILQQKELSQRISRINTIKKVRYIAGIDTSIRKSTDTGCAAVVLFKYPELTLVESQTYSGTIPFPYITGLLSFREIPLTLKAFNKLTIKPDLVLVDGQGIAHPRRIGFASHFGLVTNTATIGCAKSRLCGKFDPPPSNKGAFSDLLEKDEIIGAVVRTRNNIKPLFISIGHNIDLPTSIYWVLECCRGYRLPEPCRIAHITAKNSSK